MKHIIFIFLMASATMLFASSNEQKLIQNAELGKYQLNDVQAFKMVKNRTRDHKHHDCGCNRDHNKAEAFGSFFTTDQGVVVNPGFPILFDRVSVQTRDVSLIAGGNILIKQRGDYFVNFGVSAVSPDGISPPEIALALDDVFPQLGSNLALLSNQQLTSGSTIVHVENVPAVLSVINFGALGLILSSPQDGDITAFISVLKLDDQNSNLNP